jgi:hypothetical protein
MSQYVVRARRVALQQWLKALVLHDSAAAAGRPEVLQFLGLAGCPMHDDDDEYIEW